MINQPPTLTKTCQQPPPLKAMWLDSPLGQMLAIADNQSLHLFEFFDSKALEQKIRKLERANNAPIDFATTAVLQQLNTELQAYFSGTACHFSIALTLHGTLFMQQVWQALTQIPCGKTQSYSETAKVLDKPTAARAVGSAIGKNQLALLVPCHRVIGADNSLTGYAAATWRKKWLLRHEKNAFS